MADTDHAGVEFPWHPYPMAYLRLPTAEFCLSGTPLVWDGDKVRRAPQPQLDDLGDEGERISRGFVVNDDMAVNARG